MIFTAKPTQTPETRHTEATEAKATKELPQTKPLPTPMWPSPLRLYSSKHIFLGDPMQTSKITINHSHFVNLDGKNFLCRGLLDYLIQRSIKVCKAQQTIIASTLSLSITQTYLQMEQNDPRSDIVPQRNEKKIIQKNYEYYSFDEFNCFLFGMFQWTFLHYQFEV
jgi:hypothetical protein